MPRHAAEFEPDDPIGPVSSSRVDESPCGEPVLEIARNSCSSALGLGNDSGVRDVAETPIESVLWSASRHAQMSAEKEQYINLSSLAIIRVALQEIASFSYVCRSDVCTG